MPRKKDILSGPKINNRHSSFIDLAGEIIKKLKPLPKVTKIVLGPIKPIRTGPRRIKVKEDKGQVRIQCRDTNSVQLLWVIGEDAQVIESALQKIIKRLQ